MFNMYKGKAPCHIFLTGEKHVGKSTLVSKVLSQINVEYSGLRSVSVIDHNGRRCVYLVPVNQEKPDYTALAGICSDCHITERHPEIFDSVGCSLITPGTGVNLIVIDEIGRMEAGASAYIGKIMSLIERTDICILGVIQSMADEKLVSNIKNHPNVKTFVVKEANRDRLVPVVKRLLSFETV